MASIRVRLTWGYSFALLTTLLIFSAAILVARRASTIDELSESARTFADVAVRILRDAGTAGENVLVTSDESTGPVLDTRWRSRLEPIPGYVIVIDRTRQLIIYQSDPVRRLPASDHDALIEAVSTLDRASSTLLALSGGDLVLVARHDSDPRYPMFSVVAGLSASGIDRSLRELSAGLVIVLPLIIVLSIAAAFVIAGRAVQPVDEITSELEAITDGRSLHRRLPVDTSGDELGRLTSTLNDMIGRLETSFGALRRFTADASHELKTPLTVLRADVERAMHAPAAGTEQLIALEEALAETTRMADLVDSLLTLARADEGRFDLYLEPVELGPLVREVLETTHILGEAGGQRVIMTGGETEAMVMGDGTRLRQLFLNLVTNAIKYTPSGGEVVLSLLREGSDAVFSVRDTGIGIAAGDLPYIFERFWRADRARSRAAERGGFGLGLAIAQWIAQAHGGTLTVQSRLHRGTTFVVTLPMPRDLPPRGDGIQGAVDGSQLPRPQAAG